jgi:malate dehydrogenase (oxaloacetate-decarboxylating)
MSTELDLAAFAAHERRRGKLHTEPNELLTAENLPLFYTPGVGSVARHLAGNPQDLGRLTMQGNLVAVVSDGSAVLGLKNIGPAGAYPVMEGKAMLFKALAGVDAVPIILSTQDPDEIVAAITAIAPTFAGINLEDIAAPKCYEIERRLQEKLAIPVMHDDQHATAIVTLAGLMNACKVTNRDLRQARIVILGAGAAGSAVARLLLSYGAKEILLVDSKGIIGPDRQDLDANKEALAAMTNPNCESGTLTTALEGADVVVGLASAGLLTPALIERMAKDPIVFALSNPEPEIYPEQAIEAGAAVVATGRSDFPNQINNVLVFPGIFRGAFDHGVVRISDSVKLAAAHFLANLVLEPTSEYIVPSVFDERVVPAVAEAVKRGSENPDEFVA